MLKIQPLNQVYVASFDLGENFIIIIAGHLVELFTSEAQFSLVANPRIIHKCYKCRLSKMIFSQLYNRTALKKRCHESKSVQTRQTATVIN